MKQQAIRIVDELNHEMYSFEERKQMGIEIVDRVIKELMLRDGDNKKSFDDLNKIKEHINEL